MMGHPATVAVALLVAVAFLVPWSSPVPAADPEPEAVRVEAVVVPKGNVQRLQTKFKTPIRQVTNSNNKVVEVQPVRTDPTRVTLKGVAPGVSRLTLIDVNQA